LFDADVPHSSSEIQRFEDFMLLAVYVFWQTLPLKWLSGSVTDRRRRKAFAESLLPPEVLARASLRGNEYAWPIDDIPAVITAAQRAALASLGGQLQFRLSDGGTCECYWVDIDIRVDELPGSGWSEKVRHAGEIARKRFDQIQRRYNFLDEGRTFQSVRKAETEGEDLRAAMCFVWYVADEAGWWEHGLELN